MKTRAFFALSAALPAVLAAGCADEPVVEETTSTVTSTTTVEADEPVDDSDAFTFSSGDIALGPPEGEGELFNACESLTADELEDADLEVAGDVDETETSLSCPMIKDGDSAVAYVVTSAAGSRATINELDPSIEVAETKASTSVPNLYIGQYGGEPPMCGAFVDTARGIFSVTVLDVHGETPMEKACEQAQETLEQLYAIGK